MRGVPLIATSPVRHESPVQMNALDVHSYQPPWKALADYASMQHDIDPSTPQFQHLVSQVRIPEADSTTGVCVYSPLSGPGVKSSNNLTL